jgi:acyl carrier protein
MSPNQSEISEWCTRKLATILEMPVEKIEPSTKFARLGMDSIHMSELIVALEDWLTIELDPEVALNYPTIDQLSEHLAGLRAEQAV